MLTGEYNHNSDNRRFNFRPIVVQDIRDAMSNIKTSKSLGSDNISSYFLKLATPYIENSLVFMFNTSLETSQLPDSWKMLGLHQFSRMVIGLKSLITAQFQFFLSFQGSLKN